MIDEPVDLEPLLFVSSDGNRRLGTPNRLDRALAEALIADRALWQPYGDTYLATVLAAVREGSTIEGPRKIVNGHTEIPRQIYAGPDGVRTIESATKHAWRSWFGELVRGGLRPVGWPTVQRTYLAWPVLGASTTGLVEVDPERAEILALSVSCETVPA